MGQYILEDARMNIETFVQNQRWSDISTGHSTHQNLMKNTNAPSK